MMKERFVVDTAIMHAYACIFGMSLELFIILVVIGIAIVSAIVVAIKKLRTTPIEEVLEGTLEETLKVKEEPLESKLLMKLTDIKGIGPKGAGKLKATGINTVMDLAASSAKDLSQKTGISEKIVSKWIEQAKEIIE